jgi:hypothetical protein
MSVAMGSMLLFAVAANLRAQIPVQAPRIASAVIATTTMPNQITLTGTGFGVSMPLVTMDEIPLLVLNFTDANVLALVPAGISNHPGTYNLTLTNTATPSNAGAHQGSIDVTVGAVGPPGLKGDTGARGEAGPPGPSGTNGTNGTPGVSGYEVVAKTKFLSDDGQPFALTVDCPANKSVLGVRPRNSFHAD